MSIQGHHLLMTPDERDSASVKRLQLEDLCDWVKGQQQGLSSLQEYGRRISHVTMMYIVDFIKLFPKGLVKTNVEEELEDRPT